MALCTGLGQASLHTHGTKKPRSREVHIPFPVTKQSGNSEMQTCACLTSELLVSPPRDRASHSAGIAQSNHRGYLEDAALERSLEGPGRFRQVKTRRRSKETSVVKGSESGPGLVDSGAL